MNKENKASIAVWILVAASLAQATEAYCIQGIPTLLGFVRQQIPLTELQVGCLLGAPYHANLVFAIAIGWLLQRWGVRRVIFGGLVLMTVGTACCSTSMSFWQIYAGLLLTGMGFTTVYPGTTQAVMEHSPPHLRGTYMGIKQMGVTLGAAVGAFALPGIAAAKSWHSSLAVVSATVAVSALLWLCLSRDRIPNRVTRIQARPRQEIRASLRRVCGMRLVWRVNALGGVLLLVQATSTGWLPTFLQARALWSPVEAGKALGVLQVGGALGRAAFGALSDRAPGGRHIVACVCALAGSACALIMSTVSSATSMSACLLLCFVTGFFVVGWVGVVTVMRAELCVTDSGLVTSFGLAFMALGAVIGPPIFGWLTHNQTTYAFAWKMVSLASLVGGGLAAASRPTRADSLPKQE